MTEADDIRFMRRALRLAARATGRTSPNPLVGAVVVRNGEIVGEGFHKAAGEPHAEVNALRAAQGRARGATLYTTLEPCAHTGRTPPCVNAIREAGVARVVSALRDPDPRTDGKGFRALRAAEVDVTVGLLEGDAKRLNEGFISRTTRGRPFVLVKLATTLDGRVAVKGRRYLSGKAALREVHRLRDRYDAVLVGSGTVLADDPALTVREVKGRDPLRVVVDTDARTPPTAKVVRAKDPQRTIMFVARDADIRRVSRLRDAGVLVTTLPRADGGLDLAAVLRWLAEKGVNTVMSEAGPKIASRLVASGLADRLMLITAPIVGGGGPTAFEGLGDTIALHSVRTRRFGDDVAMEGDLQVFTGIVQEIGTVRHSEPTRSGARIEVAASRVMERLAIDDSISVAGVCLTVVGRDDRSFTSDVVPETLARSTLGGLARGSRVNLEAAARPETALGGHFVQGHVDATAKLLERSAEGEGARLRFALPKTLARYVVLKGFITLDGVSLTVARLGKTFFEIALIPHTAERTTLGALRPRDAVNVEVDVIAKYVERIVRAR